MVDEELTGLILACEMPQKPVVGFISLYYLRLLSLLRHKGNIQYSCGPVCYLDHFYVKQKV